MEVTTSPLCLAASAAPDPETIRYEIAPTPLSVLSDIPQEMLFLACSERRRSCGVHRFIPLDVREVELVAMDNDAQAFHFLRQPFHLPKRAPISSAFSLARRK